MYLCNCHGITEQQVIDLVNNSESVFHYAALTKVLKDSSSCCKCLPRTREVIDEANKAKAIRKSSTRISEVTTRHVKGTAGILIVSEPGDIPIG